MSTAVAREGWSRSWREYTVRSRLRRSYLAGIVWMPISTRAPPGCSSGVPAGVSTLCIVDGAVARRSVGEPGQPVPPPEKKDWRRKSFGWTTKTVNARKPAPRTRSRRWLAVTGEPAPPMPSCLYNGDDMLAAVAAAN
jgi:hypothetical protein